MARLRTPGLLLIAALAGACREDVPVAGPVVVDVSQPSNDAQITPGQGADVDATVHADAASGMDASGDSDADDIGQADGSPAPCDPAACEDGDPCTLAECQEPAGCVQVAVAGPCDDGDACTVADACVGGTCVGGLPATCDDQAPCTDDTCDATAGCLHLPNAATCSDGDACTVGDGCGGGACLPGAPTSCDDQAPCTADSCDALLGCLHLAIAATCTDGDVCTVGDGCASGACVAGPVALCDDQNPCTDDSCDSTVGCVYLANAATCTDGNACTIGDGCDAGTCLPGVLAACDDQSPCTADSCAATVGCVHLAQAASCTDGNACTIGDTCAGGACLPGAATSCDDGDPCTLDVCKPASGCKNTTDPLPCAGTSECPVGHVCTVGLCKPGPGKAWMRRVGGPAADLFMDVTAVQAGYVAVGYTIHPGKLPSAPLIARFDAEGTLLPVDVTSPGDLGGELYTVTAEPDGGFVSGGKWWHPDGDGRLWLQRHDAQGKLLWSKTYGDVWGHEVRRILIQPGGGYWLATQYGTLPYLATLDSQGLLVDNSVYGNSKYQKSFTVSADDLVALPQGGLLLAWNSNQSGFPCSYLGGCMTARCTARKGSGSGWKLIKPVSSPDLLNTHIGALAPLDNGTVVGVVNATWFGEGAVQLLTWLDPADWGKQTYAVVNQPGATVYSGFDRQVQDLAVSPQGEFLMAGSRLQAGLDLYWLRAAPNGAKVAEGVMGGKQDDRARACLWMPDGGLLLVGATASWGKEGSIFKGNGWPTMPKYKDYPTGDTDGWLVRTDPTPPPACGLPACATDSVSSCEDGDPCTFDYCDTGTCRTAQILDCP